MLIYIYISLNFRITAFLENKFQLEFNLSYMNNINNIKQCEQHK